MTWEGPPARPSLCRGMEGKAADTKQLSWGLPIPGACEHPPRPLLHQEAERSKW